MRPLVVPAPAVTAPRHGGETVIHLALDPAPPLTRVVEVTDLIRQVALWNLDDDSQGRGSLLAGKTADGEPMRGHGHRHAHWLPVTDGRIIGGVCCWSPAPLSPGEEAAVLGVAACGGTPGRPWLRVHTVAGGWPPPFRGPARAWESVTPFVQPRWAWRSRGRADGRTRGGRRPGDAEIGRHVAGLVASEIMSRGLPAPVAVEVLGTEHGWPASRPSRPAPVPQPCRVRVEFATPVRGPLAIGRLSHFGLGLMRPAPGS